MHLKTLILRHIQHDVHVRPKIHIYICVLVVAPKYSGANIYTIGRTGRGVIID